MKTRLLAALALLALTPVLRAAQIGVETFNYSNGAIAGQSGGTGWDYKNFSPAGHTGTASSWSNVSGTPAVSSGQLVTNNSSAKRTYDGANETDGAVNDPASAPSSVEHVVYCRVNFTTGATLPDFAGLSSYDFTNERVFFGKGFGDSHFGIQIVGNAFVPSATVVQPNTTYTLVTKIDYVNNVVALYINPTFAAGEPATADVSLAYTDTVWSTAVRLASGNNNAPVAWDNLAAGTTWQDVATATLLNEREGIEFIDFPNSAAAVTPAFTYPLLVGNNFFSGTVAVGSGDSDFFQVVVAPGTKVTQITTNTGFLSVPTAPLYAGTYLVSCAPGLILSDVNWTATFTVVAVGDYEVTTSGGFITASDRSGNSDTLTLSEPAAGQILISAPGRTFNVNGGPIRSGDSGNLTYNVANGSITVDAGAGDDTINVGAFTSQLAALILKGGPGNDTVNFTGNITFHPLANLLINDVDGTGTPTMETVNVAAGAHVQVTGNGSNNNISINCARNVSVATGASLGSSDAGDVRVVANMQSTPATGSFNGVRVSGGSIFSQNGQVTVQGRGGNDAGGAQLGVEVVNGGAITTHGPNGTLNVTGIGGDNTGTVNRGVTVSGGSSVIRADNASVNVTGTGGPNGTSFGIGVSVLSGGTIVGPVLNPKNATVTGTGAGTGGSNQGIEIGGAGSAIASQGADVVVNGTAGAGTSSGVFLATSAAINTPAAGGSVTVNTDSLAIDNTSAISTANAASKVTLASLTGLQIDLGGANPSGTFSLSNAVLNRITTGELVLSGAPGGGNGPGGIATSANVSPANVGTLTLSGGTVSPLASGTDVTLDAGRTVKLNGTLFIGFSGGTVDSGYPQLAVVGKVNLNNAPLSLTALVGFTGSAGQTFTIVNNDGTEPITGTFQNLPEGASFAWPGSPTLNARISYQGGDGNDAVITLVSAQAVTNANDTGIGSLRGVVAYAATLPSATVNFDPSLSGQTITLASDIHLTGGNVTVDASALSGGLTLNGGGTHRIFTIDAFSQNPSLSLIGLTLTGGNGNGALFNNTGGAIFTNGDTLSADRCTFTGNSAGVNGGAIQDQGHTTTITRCTFTGNSVSSASGAGGAILTLSAHITSCTFSNNSAARGGAVFFPNSPFATITHCTISGNSATTSGGGIDDNGSNGGGGGQLTLTNSIVSGNTVNGSASDIHVQSATLTRGGANLVGVIVNEGGTINGSGTVSNADPRLAPLDFYGGPTQTMALKPGSPARDAAISSSITSDQRGFPIVGTRDIGAYEAGTLAPNYNAYIWESLPATATPAQHAAGVDFDGDGVTNYNEWLALTNPAENTSYFHITDSSLSNGYLSVFFPTGTGRNYIVEFTTALSANTVWNPWQTVSGNGGIQGSLIGPLPPSITQLFVRIRTGP